MAGDPLRFARYVVAPAVGAGLIGGVAADVAGVANVSLQVPGPQTIGAGPGPSVLAKRPPLPVDPQPASATSVPSPDTWQVDLNVSEDAAPDPTQWDKAMW
jgi:hypothetical protein